MTEKTHPGLSIGCRNRHRCRKIYGWMVRSQRVVECSMKIAQQLMVIVGCACATYFLLTHLDKVETFVQVLLGKIP